jgi:hypothetical protein
MTNRSGKYLRGEHEKDVFAFRGVEHGKTFRYMRNLTRTCEPLEQVLGDVRENDGGICLS